MSLRLALCPDSGVTHCQTVHDCNTFALLNDIWKHAERRRDALITPTSSRLRIDVDVAVCTVRPGDVRCMNRVLYVCAVEVDELLSGAWESEDAPGDRPLFCYAVHIECGIEPSNDGEFKTWRIV